MDLLPPHDILIVWLGTAAVWLVVLVGGLVQQARGRRRGKKP